MLDMADVEGEEGLVVNGPMMSEEQVAGWRRTLAHRLECHVNTSQGQQNKTKTKQANTKHSVIRQTVGISGHIRAKILSHSPTQHTNLDQNESN